MQHSAAGSMNVIDQVAPVKTIPSRSKSPTHSGGFFDRCVTLLLCVQIYSDIVTGLIVILLIMIAVVAGEY